MFHQVNVTLRKLAVDEHLSTLELTRSLIIMSLSSRQLKSLSTVELQILSHSQRSVFDLSKNSLSDISLLPKLPHLIVLNLSNNLLTTLPSTMIHMKSLQKLNLNSNRFQQLPVFLGTLPSLRELSARDNPLSGQQLAFARDDASLLSVLPNTLLTYLKQCQEHMEPLTHIRMVVLGHGDAGKTTICDAMKLRKGTVDPNKRLTIRPTLSEHDDKESKLSWHYSDMPGQPQFYTTVRKFLVADNAVIIVAFNLLEADHWQVLELWLSCIEQLVADNLSSCCTILVGTRRKEWETKHSAHLTQSKADMNKLLDEMKTTYPHANIKEMVLVEAVDATEVNRLLWPVARKLAVELLKDQWGPLFLRDLREKIRLWRLTEMCCKRPFVTQNELFHLLQFDVDFGMQLGSLSMCQFAFTALKRMGEVLCLDNGTVILDPVWLSAAMSLLVEPPKCASPHRFNGLPMKNGVVDSADVLNQLDERALVLTKQMGPKVLQLLHALDIFMMMTTREEKQQRQQQRIQLQQNELTAEEKKKEKRLEGQHEKKRYQSDV